jgi:peptidoglycan/xylan/chitin deacetylase (PgdA/CDA1 family)
LTFDDGPSEWTASILDLMAEHGARGTFFLIGSHIAGRRELVERMHAEGHEIGNHTWSHPSLTRDCDDSQVHDELARTNEALAKALGFPPSRFRAPRYEVDARVERIAARIGLRHTRGDVRPPDWKAQCTPRFITAFALPQVRAGTIVGLHDGVPPGHHNATASRDATVVAVAMMLPRLLALGHTLVTASTLLAAEGSS